MGETLAETRLEIDAQRAQLQQTADRLRARVERAVDIKAKVRENPFAFVGLGAGAVFLLAGGPTRVARLIRRRVAPTRPEKAYDSLPRPLQDLVDTVAERVGPRAGEARQALAVELARWRHDPRHNKKMEKQLAKEMVDGPPGPGRTAWRAFEAAAAILSAALARKAVERFLSGEPPVGMVPAADAVATLGGAAEPDRGAASR
ncbi:MAG: hypothetical protein M3295_08860 [Chloroflexota bacterium]|nr:hypothetical protein [Chloroflexota bacterium]